MLGSRRTALVLHPLCVFPGLTAFDQSYSDEVIVPAAGIDHLLYATSDLRQGMDEIEALLGARPVRAGRHPLYGTHNALLSLGPGVYLEVIARDPELAPPERGALVDVPPGARSRIMTWAHRAPNLSAAAATARDAGVALGPVATGGRTRPDGSQIRWLLTDPYAMPMDGAVPFLISWHDTEHPSGTVPAGGQLVELIIEHPDVDGVRDALNALGATASVRSGDIVRLSAGIRTESGLITLQ